MKLKPFFSLLIISGFTAGLGACAAPLSWPESPLYTVPASDPQWTPPLDKQAALKLITGHYAHYDVVSYEETNTRTPMRTMVITYGFTDLYVENGRLYQKDSFCHAEQKINQKSVKAVFSDKATRAIKPRVQEVELKNMGGQWIIYRPASPTLLGIDGDPAQPLSRNPQDPGLTDPDGDGHPGVTVELRIGGFMKGFIYITRREIYQNHLTLHSDGNLYGHVVDSSEQFVVGATMKILRQQSNPHQNPDPGLNPLMLIRISEDIDTCEELMENSAQWFPLEPEFL